MASGKKLTKLCVVAVTGVLTACGGDGGDSAEIAVNDTTMTTVAPAVPIPTDTGAAASTVPAAPGATPAPGAAPGAAPAPSTPAPSAPAPAASGGGGNAAAGQQVYSGAGFCFTCHGPGGVGTALGPNLTDATWIWFPGKSSEAQVIAQINTGVPQPKQHPAPMPPRGGGQLNDAQIRDVAAYVLSLSR